MYTCNISYCTYVTWCVQNYRLNIMYAKHLLVIFHSDTNVGQFSKEDSTLYVLSLLIFQSSSYYFVKIQKGRKTVVHITVRMKCFKLWVVPYCGFCQNDIKERDGPRVRSAGISRSRWENSARVYERK